MIWQLRVKGLAFGVEGAHEYPLVVGDWFVFDIESETRELIRNTSVVEAAQTFNTRTRATRELIRFPSVVDAAQPMYGCWLGEKTINVEMLPRARVRA